ncbi:MAG: shikimate dehydrogenase [Pirellulaceae bacterium]
MICVSIGRGRHRMMLAELEHVVENGVEMVELRLDYIRRPVDMTRLLHNQKAQIIATCRRPAEGGRWMRSEDDRLVVLRTAIANGVDWVDLEPDTAEKIPRYGKTKRIISYHNFTETPKDLEKIHRKLAKLDADVVKIATLANNPMDNFRILRLLRDADVPTVAFCMGEMGLMSRVLCGKFGSRWTYASIDADRQIAPGQLSWKELRDNYAFDNIKPSTGVLGVIADPVAHSHSPRVHNAMIRKLGLDLIYLPFRVPAEFLDDFVRCSPEMDIRGLSVTIPHKEKILKNLNVLDDSAVGLRSVNTAVFKGENGFGYNTDIDAAMSVIAEHFERELDSPTCFSDKRVLIIGAGGVARTIAYGLKKKGAAVTITARDFRKSDQLANELKCQTIDWSGRKNFDCNLIINCTPVGMYPEMDESPFEADWFDSRTVVFDTIYNPEQTLFIKQARKAGCETITGVDMFVRQAAKQFELFTGQPADIDLMRNEIKRATSAAIY